MGLFSLNAMAQKQTSGFVANAGQMKATDGALRSDLLFSTQVQGAKVFLTKTGINYVWYRSAVDTTLEKDSTYRMEVEFKNANPNVLVQSSDVQTSYSNYFVGNISVANVAEYRKVTYKNLWPNIDLEITTNKSGLSYNYMLAKGANPADIQLVYNGGKKFSNKSKVLDIDVAFGKQLKVSSLKIMQTSGSKTGLTATINTTITNKNLIKANTSNYNPNESYEISQNVANSTGPTPGPFVNNSWTTYFGGSNLDELTDVFTSKDDTLWVTGTTNSIDFPTFADAIQPLLSDLSDIFISKFLPDRKLVYSTYFGSTGRDVSTQIAVNSIGEIYFCGFADRYNSGTYPQVSLNGISYQSGILSQPVQDGVISKITSSGNAVIWSTYFGGEKIEGISGLSISSDDNVYIVGGTNSKSLPVKNLPGAFNQTFNDCLDAGNQTNGFLASFNSNDELIWCSYYGGPGEEGLTSCTIDQNDNLFIYGTTTSSGSNGGCGVFSVPMPICGPNGSYTEADNKGFVDLFITKFNRGGLIDWATLYGGESYDNSGYYNAITTDRNGDVYITGSTQGRFLLKDKVDAYNQTAYGGGDTDAFIVRFSNSGTLKWSTYLGGEKSEFGNAIQPGGKFGILVGGNTRSTSFPVLQLAGSFYQGTLSNNGVDDSTDCFLTFLDNDDDLYMSTYIGGFNFDDINSIGTALGNNHIFLGGITASIDFPVFDPVGSVDYFNGSLNFMANTFRTDGFIMNLEIVCIRCFNNGKIANNTSGKFSQIIYPNPTEKIAFLDSEKNDNATHVEIFDALGRFLFKQNIEVGQTTSLNFENYEPGLYLVNIYTIDGIKTEKLIVF